MYMVPGAGGRIGGRVDSLFSVETDCSSTDSGLAGTAARYDLQPVRLPVVSGFSLKALAWAIEGPLRPWIVRTLCHRAGIEGFRKLQVEESPMAHPLAVSGPAAGGTGALQPGEWPGPKEGESVGFRFPSVHDFAAAYREGRVTPEEVAQRVIASIKASESTNPPLRAFIAHLPEDLLKQAESSTRRIRSGRALSLLDGVPVAVKDEVDMIPYPTTAGTAFLGVKAAQEDATVVARFRALGAMLIGKTNMHEIGIGVTGLNRIHGTPRNPCAPAHYTGGSSSGSAAAVAAGLCPLAIAADGGGSIRIPSAFCGLVGLKPTYGRVSEHGAVPLCWSVAHIGPIAANVADAAIGYAVMAGPDPLDPMTLRQPRPTLEGIDCPDLAGMTLGVFWPWFRHARPEVVAACEMVVERFEGLGARIRSVGIPDLEAARVAHAITIASEMAQALDPWWEAHHLEHGLDVRINLGLARSYTAEDYIRAQRVRTRITAQLNGLLREVDAVVTPTTAVTAPLITRAALDGGESDLATLSEIMRFVTVANLTGFPAVSFPAGYTAQGLTVGMQAIGRPYGEATLLRLAGAAERFVERKEPRLFYRLLSSGT